MLRLKESEVLNALRAFYELTSISIVLFDYRFNQVLSYPEHRAPLCELFWAHPKLRERCIRSDQDAFRRCSRQNTATVYICHAGLCEAIVPLKIDDVIVAYVMFGQVYSGSDRAGFNQHIAAIMTEADVPEAQWQPALDSVQNVSSDKLNAAATVLEALVLYFKANQLVSMGQQEFVDTINQYIAAHIRETIRVSDLCTEFAIGRTHLYELMRTHFGCGLNDYIQRYRIDQAASLLSQTSLSIAEIASATGFNDYNYFCRTFKKHTGLTARKYREASRHS